MKQKSEEKTNTKSPSGAESKVIEDKKNLDDWTKQGNATPAFSNEHDTYVQTDAKVKVDTKAEVKVDTKADAQRKAKQTTNTSA